MDKTVKYVPAKIVRDLNDEENFAVKVINRPVFVKEKLLQVSDVRLESGVFAPKRYVTTCYLKCFMQPYWYSETMHLKIGSSKKRHEEHVLFKNKLIPAHWSETMTTEVGDVKIRTAKVEVPVDDAGYHYMSLVPQQIAAGAKDLAVEI